MVDNSFFAQPTEASEIKSDIVVKYFNAWANIMVSQAQKGKWDKLFYVDLYSGPGYYQDDSPSTPIKILKTLSDSDKFCPYITLVFNDVNTENYQSVQQAIASHPNYGKLRHKPIILNLDVQDAYREFETTINPKQNPCLYFLDPWGYKGITQELLKKTIQNSGCDLLFFFNYNRINMGIPNDIVSPHINSLFGEERAIDILPDLKVRGFI
jgi:three-Cys-motif partner protein